MKKMTTMTTRGDSLAATLLKSVWTLRRVFPISIPRSIPRSIEHPRHNYRRRRKQRQNLPFSVLILCIACFATLSFSNSLDQDKKESSLKEKEDIIVAMTVNGEMTGISKRSGKIIWNQPSSSSSVLFSPLVSSSSQSLSSRSLSRKLKTSAVLSPLEGAVYLNFHGKHKSCILIKDLVSKTPFFDSTAQKLYVGSRSSYIALLDKASGDVIKITRAESNLKELTNSFKEEKENREVFWIGRVDYSVVIHDTRSGDVDVRFTTSDILSLDEMILGDDYSEKQVDMNDYSDNISLLSTPDGNIALYNTDSQSNEILSVESQFDSSVIFAMDTLTGRSLTVVIDISDDSELQETKTIMGKLPNGQEFYLPSEQIGSRFERMQQTRTRESLSALEPGHPRLGVTKVGKVYLHSEHDSRNTDTHKCSMNNIRYPACLVGISSHNYNHDHHPNDKNNKKKKDNNNVQDSLNVNNHLHTDNIKAQPFNQYNERNYHFWFRFFLKLMASWVPPAVALAFVVSFEVGRRERLKAENIDLYSESFNQDSSNIDNKTKISNHKNNTIEMTMQHPEQLIQVTDEVLGYGGHGTVVYKGKLEGRHVAVKRLLKAYHASADREISLLIESDGHPNVVRYFLKEARSDFVYLALELCDLSLQDLISALIQKSKDIVRSDAIRQMLFNIASGVEHLHSLRIVHRDLKPQNILLALNKKKNNDNENNNYDNNNQTVIDNDDAVCKSFDNHQYIPKISDMGLGKQLVGQSSLTPSYHHSSTALNTGNGGGIPGPGSVGWQAPEVMRMSMIRYSPHNNQQPQNNNDASKSSMMEASPLTLPTNNNCHSDRITSRSVDIFSLGCIFYCTLLPGQHPYGEWYEREANIMKNLPNTQTLLEKCPQAHDLVYRMIVWNSKQRLTASQVCQHPFFWNAAKRLTFLSEFSDRMELSSSPSAASFSSSHLIKEIDPWKVEQNAAQIVGVAWDQKLDADFIQQVNKFRTYDPSSVRDCLRVIRNKYHHYDELTTLVKEKVGTNPDGLLDYFEVRFPKLLMHCYTVCLELLNKEDAFCVKYDIPSKMTDDTDSHLNTSPEGTDSTDAETLSKNVHNDTPTIIHPQCKQSLSASSLSIDLLQQQAHHQNNIPNNYQNNKMIIWEGSNAAKSFHSRGWIRSDQEWTRQTTSDITNRTSSNNKTLNNMNNNLKRCATDPKFRTRLCNHWDVSQGTYCPMRKKNKCVFAHGPVELRVKGGKKHRWGKLVDKNGDNANMCHSGGEDTYGAARSIETMRKEEGKWNMEKGGKEWGGRGGRQAKKKEKG